MQENCHRLARLPDVKNMHAMHAQPGIQGVQPASCCMRRQKRHNFGAHVAVLQIIRKALQPLKEASPAYGRC
jgi:hypothetical protein